MSRRPTRVPRASALTDAAIRNALQAAEAPLKRTDLHSRLDEYAGPLEYMTGCLEVLVEQGKVLRFGVGDGATYWWRETTLRVSRQSFRTKVMG